MQLPCRGGLRLWWTRAAFFSPWPNCWRCCPGVAGGMAQRWFRRAVAIERTAALERAVFCYLINSYQRLLHMRLKPVWLE